MTPDIFRLKAHVDPFRLKVEATSRFRRARTIARVAACGLVVTAASIVLVPIGVATLFRARRLYSRIARLTSLTVLSICGVRLRVHHAVPFPTSQTVYISNHTSTLDLFILVALGLPNCRFFLSGFLRKMVPLGIISWMMGTFFTVPQDRPDERRRIFQRAERTLRGTGESVYLSPEGGRITTGRIGHFNKGAFHLATNLHVPIVPMYLRIPRAMDPGRGYDARPGTVHVYVYPAIETRDWRLEDLATNIERVRVFMMRVHESFS
jgi:1-acyl-sn-glycerol-3-phosphate acyltransferase